VHCACHRLSLVVCQACKVQRVKNLIEQVKDISYFFNLSPKRSSCLNKYAFPGQAKLIDPSRTRWIQKLKSLDIFYQNFIPVFKAMEEMGFNVDKSYNPDTSSKASSYLRLMTDFSFIVSLVLTMQAMDYFYDISVNLQTKSFDISQQCALIDNLKKTLNDINNNIDVFHSEWYTIATDLAKTECLDVQEKSLGCVEDSLIEIIIQVQLFLTISNVV
jgi:hypothetical protein